MPEPQLITPGSSTWPSAVDALTRPPRALYLLGALPDLTRAVAIVGTRRADLASERFTRQLASELAQADCIVVSGGALGIDAAAHLGALEAGGQTVAVLATGIVRPYPARHGPLFARIAQQGAVLSEKRDRQSAYKSAFLERNRLIAALAAVTVVVQAPLASGALSTAAHARKLARPLLVVPHAPWQPEGAGCLSLLCQGARACSGSADVLALLAHEGQRPSVSARKIAPKRVKTVPSGLDEDEHAVLLALGTESLCADDLCERASLPPARVHRAILMLLLAKHIDEVASGRYAAAG